MELSRSQIDAAGHRIGKAVRSGLQPDDADLGVVTELRAEHLHGALLLQELVVDIRNRLVERLQVPAEFQSLWQAAARPKTVEAIVAKLGRSSTSLSSMQDIIGARLVVPGLAIQDAALEAFVGVAEASGRSPRVKDTREHGDELGYRAIHVVLDWAPRKAELQLRTSAQQVWAQLVEWLDQQAETDLKHGRGPADIQDWLRTISAEIRKAEVEPGYEPVTPPFPKTP
jgi:ppGpp synthetase/RelA/SpoT-type nucleotidyltranferase